MSSCIAMHFNRTTGCYLMLSVFEAIKTHFSHYLRHVFITLPVVLHTACIWQSRNNRFDLRQTHLYSIAQTLAASFGDGADILWHIGIKYLKRAHHLNLFKSVPGEQESDFQTKEIQAYLHFPYTGLFPYICQLSTYKCQYSPKGATLSEWQHKNHIIFHRTCYSSERKTWHVPSQTP